MPAARRAVRGIRGVARRRSLLPGLRAGARRACRAITRRRAAACCLPTMRRSAIGCVALRPLGARRRAAGRRGEAALRAPRSARSRRGPRTRRSGDRACASDRLPRAQARHAGRRWSRRARCTRRWGFANARRITAIRCRGSLTWPWRCAEMQRPFLASERPPRRYVRSAPTAGLPCASRRSCRDGDCRRAAPRSLPARCRRRRNRPSPARRRRRSSVARCGRSARPGRFMLATFFTWPTKCGLTSQSGPSFHAT